MQTSHLKSSARVLSTPISFSLYYVEYWLTRRHRDHIKNFTLIDHHVIPFICQLSFKMAKDKKGKSEGKKAKAAEKKIKQEKKGEKKEKAKKEKANDSDAEDVDLDAVLAEYARKQEQFLKVIESPCDSPRARASSTLIASPANDNELFLFGGEYFNGALATFFNDLYVYLINRDEWRLITSPNTPLPRSGHAWCRGGNSGGIYLFGGEFSSPKQGTFYHYNDVSISPDILDT